MSEFNSFISVSLPVEKIRHLCKDIKKNANKNNCPKSYKYTIAMDIFVNIYFAGMCK